MKKLLTVLFCFAALALFGITANAADGEEAKPKPSDFIFAFYSEQEAEEIASRICDFAECWPSYYTEDASTVWIAIRISDNPELGNPYVFSKAIAKMVQKCRETVGQVYWETDSVLTMGNNRVAGELALHIGLIMLLDYLEPVLNGRLDYWYERFDFAEINIDENRLPAFVMNWTGDFIMEILSPIYAKLK